MSHRYAARTDAAQAPMMAYLRAAGWRVVDTHMVGGGFGDFVAGKDGLTVIVEVKSDETQRKRKGITATKQAAFRAAWRGGPVIVAVTGEEVIRKIGQLPAAKGAA